MKDELSREEVAQAMQLIVDTTNEEIAETNEKFKIQHKAFGDALEILKNAGIPAVIFGQTDADDTQPVMQYNNITAFIACNNYDEEMSRDFMHSWWYKVTSNYIHYNHSMNPKEHPLKFLMGFAHAVWVTPFVEWMKGDSTYR